MVSTPTVASSSLPWAADGVDVQSPNRNLAPVSADLDPQGRLRVGGCVVSELAQRYGTPLYVLDEASLRQSCRAYRDALQRHYPGPSLALFASKANSSLAITALVASEGLGMKLENMTINDLGSAKRINIDKDNNGNTNIEFFGADGQNFDGSTLTFNDSDGAGAAGNLASGIPSCLPVARDTGLGFACASAARAHCDG